MLDLAIQNGAHAIDIEIESAEAAREKLHQFNGRAHVIVSYHNFETTPPLDPIVNRMTRIPADSYKVVTTARKPSDNARMLARPRAAARAALIVLAMGELGFPTRVLSPVFGGVYTYAAPMLAQGTAAGQVSARSLRHIYRVDKLDRASKIYGVIADPVRHSISPAVHNRAFQSRRMDAVYLPFLVSPAHLRDFFSLADRLPLAGFSVTIPHKQRIMRYLDVVDPLAKRIGAVNTVWRKAGKWRGTNTDAAGVTGPLSKRAAAAEIHGADRGQWRGGARRGVRALRRRSQDRAGGAQCRSRARARQDSATRSRWRASNSPAAISTPWFTPRRSACFPMSTIASSTDIFPARWFSIWSTILSRPFCVRMPESRAAR